MNDLTVVFRSASDIEARVVRGLLESHGIESLVSQGSPRSIFPVQVDSIAEIRIAVRPEDADEARRLIDSHRIDTTDGRVLWRFEKRVLHMTFSPDDSKLLISSSGSRREVNLLRAEDGSQIAQFDLNLLTGVKYQLPICWKVNLLLCIKIDFCQTALILLLINQKVIQLR